MFLSANAVSKARGPANATDPPTRTEKKKKSAAARLALALSSSLELTAFAYSWTDTPRAAPRVDAATMRGTDGW